MARIFIDGAYGTVGMALREHLDKLLAAGVEIIDIPVEHRRSRQARGDAYDKSDLVVLCLPDEEAAAAAVRVDRANHRAKILDASAWHRADPDWQYGLPQFGNQSLIQQAKLVANPGCFATACILAARPLALDSMDFHGITGYTAAGNNARAEARLTQFGSEHRHLPEIRQFGLPDPTLTTTVGSWARGMLVQATVDLPIAEVARCYAASYGGPGGHGVVHGVGVKGTITLDASNGTNDVQIHVAALSGTHRTGIAVVPEDVDLCVSPEGGDQNAH